MDDSIKILNDLYNSYKDNHYAYTRLQNYINNIPMWISNDLSSYEKRVNRTNELTMEHDIFCKIFLSKHKYYYLPTNNCFYEYDEKTYKIIKEDDIHYHLLSTITEEGKLVQWKHKTKTHIIKLIKERHLFKSIPDTYTIQCVLGFLQTTIFESKSSAKYFLTILGDNLLKKNNDYIFLISPNTKKILQLIDEISYIVTGTSNINNFITKHHETHNQSYYRLIQTREVLVSYEFIKDVLNKIGLDLLCVASHYSNRYQNSENYLQINNKEYLLFKSYTLFLSNNTQEQIIDGFIQQCLVIGNDDTFSISWKNMHYIWKLYLSHLNVPNMIYSNHLKDFLKNKLNYNSENDIFVNITSKYLPQISIFLQFWNKYITISSDLFNEYEADELTSLFKKVYPDINMSEDDMLKIIKHFFNPYVEILNNKYILNIQCFLWNKKNDIENFFDYYKANLLNSEEKFPDLISFDELYKQYHSFCHANMYVNKTISMVVSKDYFEKYINNILYKHVQFDKFIGNTWCKD
jgi:hypothetical protein